MCAASPWSCWEREWRFVLGFIIEPPPDKVRLVLRYVRKLGFLGFLGVSAPSVNDLTGGADHPADGIFKAGGCWPMTPPAFVMTGGVARAWADLFNVMGGFSRKPPHVRMRLMRPVGGSWNLVRILGVINEPPRVRFASGFGSCGWVLGFCGEMIVLRGFWGVELMWTGWHMDALPP